MLLFLTASGENCFHRRFLSKLFFRQPDVVNSGGVAHKTLKACSEPAKKEQ